MNDAAFWINKLHLEPHPEGGYYKESYRSNTIISANDLKATHDDERISSSLIYYLLKSDECSQFHRLKSDEVWIYNQGTALNLHILDCNGKYTKRVLGADIEQGEDMQVTVPANCWFAAELILDKSFALLTCMVTPGFVFDDFELADKSQLLRLYPGNCNLINRISK